MKRQIIKIDNNLCNGCGLCIPNCPEGAIQLIDGKARLVSDLFCDGLGACLGHCPQGAISTEVREAEAYDEFKVMANIVPQGRNTIKAHLEHLQHHGEIKLYEQAIKYLQEHHIIIPTLNEDSQKCDCGSEEIQDKYNQNLQNGRRIKGELKIPKISLGCLGTLNRIIEPVVKEQNDSSTQRISTTLQNWPIQLNLVPLQANYFQNADLLIAADCVAGSYPNFHQDFVKGHILLMACPKFDNIEKYSAKLTQIFKLNKIRSITIVIMEVPCCSGLIRLVQQALEDAGKIDEVKIGSITVSIQGFIKKN